jgi:hypothetical protein
MEDNKIERLGPGIWFLIHKESLFCQDKNSFIEFIYRLADNFPCARCKVHFKEYLSENPPEDYVRFEDGLFIWSWKFHNSVNKRLKKPVLEYEAALKLYLNSGNEEDCNFCMELDDNSSKQIRKLEFYFPANVIKKKKQKIKFNLRNL